MLFPPDIPHARRFQKHVHTYRILPDDEDFLAVQVGTAPPPHRHLLGSLGTPPRLGGRTGGSQCRMWGAGTPQPTPSSCWVDAAPHVQPLASQLCWGCGGLPVPPTSPRGLVRPRHRAVSVPGSLARLLSWRGATGVPGCWRSRQLPARAHLGRRRRVFLEEQKPLCAGRAGEGGQEKAAPGREEAEGWRLLPAAACALPAAACALPAPCPQLPGSHSPGGLSLGAGGQPPILPGRPSTRGVPSWGGLGAEGSLRWGRALHWGLPALGGGGRS